MDPNACYKRWWRALLEEDKAEAIDAYLALRAWIERGGFEPADFETSPQARRQFFTFDLRTGRLG